MSKSEVQQLRECIEAELVAMRLGLVGLATGTARHTFIHAKMDRMGNYGDQLATHIGQEQATEFTCQAYMRLIE